MQFFLFRIHSVFLQLAYARVLDSLYVVCRSTQTIIYVCSLLVSSTISLHTIVVSGSHLLLVDHLLLLFLAVVILDVLLLEVLLFGRLHLLHGSTILGLLVHGLHVVSGRQHLVAAHGTLTSAHASPLLSLAFAFLASALVQGSVQLYFASAKSVSIIHYHRHHYSRKG